MGWPYPTRRRRGLPWWLIALGALVVIAGAGVWVLFQLWGPSHRMVVEPRPVAARGDLAADEAATVALFEQASPSVVNVTNLGVRRDVFVNRSEESEEREFTLWERRRTEP